MNGLKDKVIINTRPLSSDDTVHDYLVEKGAIVLEFPMIEIVCADIEDKITEAINKIDTFDWIIFTSKNGVICFFTLFEKIRGNKIIADTVKIATIGKATANELKKNGITPFFVCSGNTSNDLLNELSTGLVNYNDHILLPLGSRAKDVLETGLSSFALVRRIDVYNTIDTIPVSSDIPGRIKKDNYDIILFTSPSGFNNFIKIMKGKRIKKEFRMACIGKTTEKEILGKGYKPLFVSPRSDGMSLAREIEKYYDKSH